MRLDAITRMSGASYKDRFERQLLTNHKERHMDRRINIEARLLVTGEMVEAAYAVTGAVDQPDNCLYASTLRHAIEAALAAAPFDVPYTTEPYPGTPGQHTKLIETPARPNQWREALEYIVRRGYTGASHVARCALRGEHWDPTGSTERSNRDA